MILKKIFLINLSAKILNFRIKKPFETRWIRNALSFLFFLNHYFKIVGLWKNRA